MHTRKDLRKLTDSEKTAFVGALLELKKQGKYDQYVEWHHHAMMCPTPLPNENPHWRYRNAAHRGPVFLPWHRDYILELEKDLQRIDSAVTLPYWDWSVDAEMSDPSQAPIWGENFMGASGSKENYFEVTTGPFAYQAGNWTIPKELDGPKLRRGFGQFADPLGVAIKTLPTKEDLKLLFEEIIYDTWPWNSAPFTVGFRNRLEGWVTPSGDHRVRHEGVQLHNRVHVWIGGTMARPVSPGDPVFFLHHCFIDKLWVEWIAKMKDFYDEPHNNHCGSHMNEVKPTPGYYLPGTGGPPRHNLEDAMFPPPWDHHRSVRPIDMLDHHQLGYRYDTEPVQEEKPKPHHTLHEAEAIRAFTL